MSGGPLAFAFTAGLIATINPCGFALLPAYLSYFLGLDSDSEGQRGEAHDPVLRALGVSAAVTSGFLVVFGIMGVLWSTVSSAIGSRLPWFTIAVGIVLIVMGIAMLRGFDPVISLPKLQLSDRRREMSSMFIFGVSYAVASLSCTIGVFIAVTSTTLRNSSFGAGVATFLAYGLGMGATLAVLTVAVALAKQGLISSFRSILAYMHIISGVLLIIAGTFVSYYAWVELQELNNGSSSSVVQAARDVQSSLQQWADQQGGVRLSVAALVIIGGAVAVSLLLRSRSRKVEVEMSDT